jgi:O-antigen ligase
MSADRQAAASIRSRSGDFSAQPVSIKWSSRLYFAIVALAPLPLGSVGGAATAMWSILLGITLLGLLTVRLRGAQLAILAAAGVLCVCYLLVLHDQLARIPWLPVAPDPLWSEAAKLLTTDVEPAVIIARNQPFYSAGLGIVSFLTLTAGVVLGSERRLARQLLWVVAISGLSYAIVGIITFLIEPSRIFLLYEKQAHVTSLTSPFVNRNTAGIYYGCCGLIWLMFCCELIEHRLPPGRLSWSRFRRRFDRRVLRRLIAFGSAWLICVLAMFLTGSRAGAGISLLAAVAAIALFFHRSVSGPYGVVLVVGGGISAALLLLQVLGGGVGSRFSAQGLSDEGRLSTYRATWHIIERHPWLGTGFGTFEWAYPAFRTDDISLSGVWKRAHDSWLELASSGGMLMAAVVVLGLAVALGVLVHGVRTRRRDLIFPVVALCSTAAAVVHSTVDFSLQIPGYAIVIFSLLGVGLIRSLRPAAPRPNHSPRSAQGAASA